MKVRDITLFACLLTCAACSSSPVLTTVSLGLDSVPEQVASISIFVEDIELGQIVATATVSAGQTTALLGVPAERPLQFTAVAYTQSPGPSPLANMPAFVARNQRVIPLDRDRISVPLNALRAGVLTLRLTGPESQTELPSGLRLTIESEQAGPSLLPLNIPRNLQLYNQTLVLPVGRYSARLEEPGREKAKWQLRNEYGIHVAAEFETITELKIGPRWDDSAGSLPQVELQLANVDGSTLADSFRLHPEQDYLVSALFPDENFETGMIKSARWKIRTEPPESLLGQMLRTEGEFDDVSKLELILFPQGEGRAEVNYLIELKDGRNVRAHQNYIIVREESENTLATQLNLSIVAPSEIAEGTELRIEILDKDGLYAKPMSGNIDFLTSDDWLYFLQGPSLDLSTVERGISFRQISRLSGPRGLELVVRATLTSTDVPSTITSTLSIDPIQFN